MITKKIKNKTNHTITNVSRSSNVATVTTDVVHGFVVGENAYVDADDNTYDANNRISSIAIPGQGQITYNTYQWNSPAKITLPGGSTTEYAYDPLMQINSIVAKDPGQNVLLTRDYHHSPTRNITDKITEHGNYAYQYDDLYRLTGAANPTTADEAYTYDAVGNRLTALGVTGPWNYNANNELLGYDIKSFTYDDNGNMTQKTVAGQVTNFIYNTEDRLVRVEDGSSSLIAEYYYDPFGRRLWKDVGGVRKYFFYADEGLIGEYDSSGTEIRTYGYAPDSVWTTDPLFQKAGGIYCWYQNDHLGTPQKIIEANGGVVWSGEYDAFGNVQINVENIVNNLRFPGQYFDAETGLYYNWNRYYDPIVGRYLRVDPIGDGLNLYDYVLNKPINSIDPWGLCKDKVPKNDYYIYNAGTENQLVWYWNENGNLQNVYVDYIGENRPYKLEENIFFFLSLWNWTGGRVG